MKGKKLIIITLLIVMLLSCILPTVQVFADTPKTVTLNSELYNAVKEYLERNNIVATFNDAQYTLSISETAIDSITQLDLSNHNIKDITGLDIFSKVTRIDLSANKLTTESNLEVLNSFNLNYLDLSSNQINDVSAITNIANIKTLNLHNQNFDEIVVIDNSIVKEGKNLYECQLPQIVKAYAKPISSKWLEEKYTNASSGLKFNWSSFNSNSDFVNLKIGDGNSKYTGLASLKIKIDDTNNKLYNSTINLHYVVINEDQRAISFKDEKLYKAVKEQLTQNQNYNSDLKKYTYKEDLYDTFYDEQKILVINENDLVNKITSLKLDNKEVTDLTGIEMFIGLEKSLNVSSNYIDTIDRVLELQDKKDIEEEKLQSRFNEKVAQLKERLAELEEAEKAAEAAQKEVETAQKEVGDYQTGAQGALNSAMAEKDAAQTAVNSAEVAVNKAENDMNTALSKITAEESSLQSAQSKLNNYKNDLENLKSQLENAIGNYNVLSNMFNTWIGDNTVSNYNNIIMYLNIYLDLTGSVHKLYKEVDEYYKSYENASIVLDEYSVNGIEQSKIKHINNATYHSEFKMIQINKANVLNNLDKCNMGTIKDKNDQIKSAQANVDTANENVKKANEEYKTAETNLENKKRDLEAKKVTLAEKETAVQAKTEELKTKKNALKEKQDKLDECNAEVAKKKTKVTDKIDDLKVIYRNFYRILVVITPELKNMTDEEFDSLNLEQAKILFAAQVAKIKAAENYLTKEEKTVLNHEYGIVCKDESEKNENDQKKSPVVEYFDELSKSLEENLDVNRYKEQLIKIRKVDAELISINKCLFDCWFGENTYCSAEYYQNAEREEDGESIIDYNSCILHYHYNNYGGYGNCKNQINGNSQVNADDVIALAHRIANAPAEDVKTYIVLPRLRELNMSENLIENIDEIGRMKELRKLYMANNEIVNLNTVDWNAMNKLYDLDLSFNNISEINSLEVLKKIKNLDLSKNLIKGKLTFTITDLKRLESLNLSSNQIDDLEYLISQFEFIAKENGMTAEKYILRNFNLNVKAQQLKMQFTTEQTLSKVKVELPKIFRQLEELQSVSTTFGINSVSGNVTSDGKSVILDAATEGTKTAVVTILDTGLIKNEDVGGNSSANNSIVEGYAGIGTGTECTITYTVTKGSSPEDPEKPSNGIIVNINTGKDSSIEEVKQVDNKNYLLVSKDTKVSEVLKEITLENTDCNLVIKDSSAENTLNETEKVKTNEVVKIEGTDEEFNCIIVVKGDVTGDGVVTMSDILKLNQARNKKIEITEAEFIAGKVTNKSEDIDMSDILKLNEYRLNKIDTL